MNYFLSFLLRILVDEDVFVPLLRLVNQIVAFLLLEDVIHLAFVLIELRPKFGSDDFVFPLVSG